MLAVTGLTIPLIAIACLSLWIGVLAPAILRSFSVPIPFGLWRLDRQEFTKVQYVWAFGVFSWGLGMFLFSTVWKYLEWKLLGDKFSYQSLAHILVGLLIWVLAGFLFGVFSEKHRKGRRPD